MKRRERRKICNDERKRERKKRNKGRREMKMTLAPLVTLICVVMLAVQNGVDALDFLFV